MEARLEVCVPYLRSAPISLVTFSDVWMMMMGLDNTWDKSICEVPAQVYIMHSTSTVERRQQVNTTGRCPSKASHPSRQHQHSSTHTGLSCS